MLAANNLDDVLDVPTARTNLGLGTMAQETATNYLTKAGNLAGLADAAAARTNLGLGVIATFDDTDFLQAANNLSELTNVPAARTALGLGTAATKAFGTSAGQLVELATGGKLPAVSGENLTNLPNTGQPIPTSSSFAVGTMAIFANAAGADMTDGSSNAGSGLRLYAGGPGNNGGSPSYAWQGQVSQSYGITPAGTWKNVTGRTVVASTSGADDYTRYGYFVRTA
jgi:hypothetical protein